MVKSVIKTFLSLSLFIFLSACSYNYAEDADYVHVHKNDVVCKRVDQYIVKRSSGRGMTSEYLVTKEKCMFFKSTEEQHNSSETERKQKLLRDLESS